MRSDAPRIAGARSFLLGKTRSAIAQLLHRYILLRARVGPAETGITEVKREQRVVVSLTTFPARIDTVWICIETLLRQRVKPDEIILWLASSQFPDADQLPAELRAQQQRGLTIRFCEDLKSHKKYFTSFQEFPDDLVITVDDDVFYPENTVEELMRLHQQYPDCICCNRAHKIALADRDSPARYSMWKKAVAGFDGPSRLLCPTGVGGVLYPPRSVHEDVFSKEDIQNICRYADDIWLKTMSLRKGTRVVTSSVFRSEFFSIPGGKEQSLSTINVGESANDRQLAAILDRYDIRFVG